LVIEGPFDLNPNRIGPARTALARMVLRQNIETARRRARTASGSQSPEIVMIFMCGGQIARREGDDRPGYAKGGTRWHRPFRIIRKV
jgi:hypothetical protein